MQCITFAFYRSLGGSLLCVLLLISGCSSAKSALKLVGLGSDNALKKITIEAAANSNLDTPVALDIIFIYDEKITPLLSELNGPQWFQQKLSFSQRFANAIDIVDIEMVPLSRIESVSLPKKHKQAKNIVLFANYRTSDGQYMAELSHFKQLTIRLLNTQYTLQPEGGQ
ncbi:hypothetical protein ACVBE9_11030 [Eionea flava]